MSVKDLELGIRTAMAWPKGPFALINEMGMKTAATLVKNAVDAGMIKMPHRFTEKIALTIQSLSGM